MLLSAFMLFIPVANEKYDKFVGLARVLKEVRVGFILTGVGLTFSLLISLVLFYTFRFTLTSSTLFQVHCNNFSVDGTWVQKCRQ